MNESVTVEICHLNYYFSIWFAVALYSLCVFFFFLFIVVHTSMGNYYTAKWLAVKKNRNCIFLMHMKHTIHSHVFVTIINALIKWIFIVQTVFIFALCHSFSTAQSGIHARALFALLFFRMSIIYIRFLFMDCFFRLFAMNVNVYI